jgi:hypothetical protein
MTLAIEARLKEMPMVNINVGKVILGGLVAGVVLNIGEALLNSVVLAKTMEEDFRRLNMSPPGGDFIAKAVVMTFILGIMIVFLYAAIRPRFGAGVKTALYAGAIAWFFIYVYVAVIQVSLGFFSMQTFLIGLVWGLVEFGAGAIAGAWVYKEAA